MTAAPMSPPGDCGGAEDKETHGAQIAAAPMPPRAGESAEDKEG